MTFLYFLPELQATGCSIEQLHAAGLQPIVEGLQVTDLALCDCSAGPSGSHGLVVVVPPAGGEPPPLIGYYPNRQTWEQFGAVWIGRDQEQPPTPEGLARGPLLGGYDRQLGDGNFWRCPTVRRAFVWPVVPQRYGRTAEGKTLRQVKPEYSGIWERSGRWAAGLLTDDPAGELTLDEKIDAAVELLGLNYRVTDAEITLLGLLDDDALQLIVEAAIDVPWLVEAETDLQKKTTLQAILAELVSSSPGAEESTQPKPTTQAEPTTS